MHSFRASGRTLCINCNICVNTLRRYVVLEQNTRLISLLSEWISPIILSTTVAQPDYCRSTRPLSLNQTRLSNTRPLSLNVTHWELPSLYGIWILSTTVAQPDYCRSTRPLSLNQTRLSDTRLLSLNVTHWELPSLYGIGIITEEDYVCEACWHILMRAVNQREVSDAPDGQRAGTSRQQGHRQVCILCGCSLTSRQSHLVYNNNPSELDSRMVTVIETRIAPRQIMLSDRICHPCWISIKRTTLRMQQIDEARAVEPQQIEREPGEEAQPENEDVLVEHPVQNVVQNPENIRLLNYRRAANTASRCLFPECNNVNLHNIRDSLRATVISTYHYYIPKNARICMEHLNIGDWDMLYNSERSLKTFTVEQVEHIFSFVNAFKSFLDFNTLETIEAIDDNLFFYWLGMTKINFTTLLNEVPRLEEAYRGVLGLAALIIKMRTGESDARLSTLLDVPRRTLERLMASVREILLQDFVPRNLGIGHIERERLLTHNLLIPNGLYNQNNSYVIVIGDGTYIYIDKSSNYSFQKYTYSPHKYRNLLKPFLLVACDGYIIDCYGPYKATTSDAVIMNSLFSDENSPLRQYFQENDIFILDRGFRESVGLLESCNYNVYIPESVLEGERQLTTSQANRSRCVTICRWVVEVVNGHLKRDFKLLRQNYFNKTVLHMMQYFQIAASLLNRFGVRLRNRSDAGEILQIIRERFNVVNNLSTMVERMNMNRRILGFRNITADRHNVTTFPRMQYNELILFALGTYQIRQARSYFGEHIRFHGRYRIEVSTETEDFSEYNLRGFGERTLIRGRIKSRHVGRRQYYVYILVQNNVSGREAILEYCCSCLVGRRTIGCCAHIMTIVWYLGWARYQHNISAPAANLDEVAVRDLDE